MELIETTKDQDTQQIEPDDKKRKRKNPFDQNKKEEKLKRKRKRARIIIRNISYKATEDSLKTHFEQFGKIEELKLLKRPDGKLVGCAFVQYESINQAAKAIFKANNKEFLGRPVFVDWAVGKDEYEKKTAGKTKKEEDEIKIEKTEDDKVDIKETASGEEEVKSEPSSNSDSKYSDDEDISGSQEDSHSEIKDDIKPQIEKDHGEKKTKFLSNDITEGCTVFIKNVPFDASKDDLRKVCRKFGPVYYALINTDPISGHSKGTGFVKFKTKESADLCLNSGEELVLMNSVLEPFPALSRDELHKKTEAAKRKEPSDSRNLYLAKEGLIMAGSKAAEGVSASDMAKRLKLERFKKQILKNLNRFVSRNRLSIHNLPLHYDDEKLRKMIEKFTGLKPHECRVMREKKPTIEHPQGKSKGFGFISLKTHEEALKTLRKLNNNPSVFGPINRPIVAFSIEDKSAYNIKQRRLKKSLENNPTYKAKLEKRSMKKKEKKKKQMDDKNQVQNKIKKLKGNEGRKAKENELDDFAGVPAKPGTFVRMRSNKKIDAQAMEHFKKVTKLKKMEKRKKEKLMLRQEKKEIDRPKQGKRKDEKDNFSFLVDKYKRLIDSTAEPEKKKIKRTKWYME